MRPYSAATPTCQPLHKPELPDFRRKYFATVEAFFAARLCVYACLLLHRPAPLSVSAPAPAESPCISKEVGYLRYIPIWGPRAGQDPCLTDCLSVKDPRTLSLSFSLGAVTGGRFRHNKPFMARRQRVLYYGTANLHCIWTSFKPSKTVVKSQIWGMQPNHLPF